MLVYSLFLSVSPKSAFDKEIHVCQELKIAQPLFDSSSFESSSDPPTPTERERRDVPTVRYKDVSSSSSDKTDNVETEQDDGKSILHFDVRPVFCHFL